jgi:hypothetical protein
MPVATVSTELVYKELKSCPGGFVKLRRMTYGERLHRQDIAMMMSMESDQKAKTAQVNLEQSQTKVAEFELGACISEHNLEDENGRSLDFHLPRDVHNLDGRVGEEIGTYIDELHDWEADLPNSEEKSTGSSTEPSPELSTANGTSTSETQPEPS